MSKKELRRKKRAERQAKTKKVLRELFPVPAKIIDFGKKLYGAGTEQFNSFMDHMADAFVEVGQSGYDLAKQTVDKAKNATIRFMNSVGAEDLPLATNDPDWYGGETYKSSYPVGAISPLINNGSNTDFELMSVLHMAVDPGELIDIDVYSTLIEATISNYDFAAGYPTGVTTAQIVTVLQSAARLYAIAKVAQRSYSARNYTLFKGYNTVSLTNRIAYAGEFIVGNAANNNEVISPTWNQVVGAQTITKTSVYLPNFAAINNNTWLADYVAKCMTLILPADVKKWIDYYFDGIFVSNIDSGNNGFVCFWPTMIAPNVSSSVTFTTTFSAYWSSYQTAITSNPALENFMLSVGFVKPVQSIDLKRIVSGDMLTVHLDDGLENAIYNSTTNHDSTPHGRYNATKDQILLITPWDDYTPDYDSSETLVSNISIGTIGECLRLWIVKASVSAISGFKRVYDSSHPIAYSDYAKQDIGYAIKIVTSGSPYSISSTYVNSIVNNFGIVTKAMDPFVAVGLVDMYDTPYILTLTQTGADAAYTITPSRPTTNTTGVDIPTDPDCILVTNLTDNLKYIKAAITMGKHIPDAMRAAKDKWASSNTYNKL